MKIDVLFWYWMSSNNDLDAVSIGDEIYKCSNVWAWRIAYNHPCRKMYDIYSVLDHLLASILNISAWATITSRIAHQFQVYICIDAEGTFSVSHSSQALSASTSPIAVADNNSNPGCFLHCKPPKCG